MGLNLMFGAMTTYYFRMSNARLCIFMSHIFYNVDMINLLNLDFYFLFLIEINLRVGLNYWDICGIKYSI